MLLKASKSQDGVEITNPVTWTLLTPTDQAATWRAFTLHENIHLTRARTTAGKKVDTYTSTRQLRAQYERQSKLSCPYGSYMMIVIS